MTGNPKKIKRGIGASMPYDAEKVHLDNVPALIWQAGIDAKCNYFNRTWIEFTGRTLEEELGDGWMQGVHPDDLEKCARNYHAAFDARQPIEFEYRLRHRDGDYRHILDTGRPVNDNEGRFAGYIGCCFDISHRKQAEARLKRSEALLAEAQAVARIGSWERDLKTDVVSWSDEYYRMMGMEPQERPVSYRHFVSLVNAEDRSRVEETIQQALRDHQPFQFEFRPNVPGMCSRVYQAKGIVACDVRGSPERLHGTVQDITAQSVAEEALRESEQRFVAFMNNKPGFAWMKDLAGRYVYINQHTERLPAYQAGWKGKTDSELWPEELWKLYQANDQNVIASGEPIQTVELILAGDERRHVLVSKFPILDKNGAVVMVGGTSIDITERIRANEALRASEERFRQFADNIDEVFWIKNIDSGRVEYVSPAYERVWKRRTEDFALNPDTWLEIIHPDDRERVKKVTSELPRKGYFDHIYRILWPDGSIRWIHDRAFPIHDGDQKLIRIAGIAEDITERKRAEQQVENFSEMLKILTNRLFEVQEEERRHIARELHDEIGQSLTAAKLEIEGAKRLTNPAAVTVRLDDALVVIEQLLGSVRALSVNLRPALLDEVGLAAAVSAHAQLQAARGGLAVQLHVDKKLERCDPAIEIACFRVAQEALTNILRHARATEVEIELQSIGDELHLRVRDNGLGFDVEAASAGAATGASFGLLSMRERVNLAGGVFICKSAAGQGTEIKVSFPS